MYKFINWYTKRFRFPHRGWKYFRFFLRKLGLLDRVFIKRIHNGYFLKLRPSEHIQQNIFWYGYYEKETILTLEEFLTPDSIMLDVGANIGYHSIVASAKAKKVIAIEPSTQARTQLQENIQLNRIENIQVFDFAAGNENKAARFFSSGQDNTGMSGLHEPENFSGFTEDIVVKKLDDWLVIEKLKIDVVKIDVEGAEWDVLAGMEKTIRRDQPIIFIEVIDAQLSPFGRSSNDIYGFLRSRNYSAYEITSPKQLRIITEPIEGYSILFVPVDKVLPKSILK